jgi:2-amino-4-hydroxy-6-hydroxymethyldihydropteridine diphosphokinase
MIVLGLGSNLGEREKNIIAAIVALKKHPDIVIHKVSSLYETEPVGVKEQPGFLNAVISIVTQLPPLELLEICLGVERDLGRIRKQRWGPRNIDIDILLYDDMTVELDRLILPHPRLHERHFVLVPLQEIAGDVPVYRGMSATELLQINADTSMVTFYKKMDIR